MAAGQAMRYKLAKAATLELTRGDLTRFDGDAIVNAANERMLGGGGVDGAIHRAAGRDLYHACREVEEVEPGVRCPTGEARITPGFHLAAKHVIHTVGPIYENAQASAPLLEAAHRSCMRLANEHGLKSIAFPAISCGIYGYPLRDAAEIALRTVQEEAYSVEQVFFFLHDPRAWTAFTETAAASLEPCKDSRAEDGAPAHSDGPAASDGQLPAIAGDDDVSKPSGKEAAAAAAYAPADGATASAAQPPAVADAGVASKPSDEEAAAATDPAVSEVPAAAAAAAADVALENDTARASEGPTASARPALEQAGAADKDASRTEAESAAQKL